MTAVYGLLAGVPLMWGYAGYVLVSAPGTAETDAPRKLRTAMRKARVSAS